MSTWKRDKENNGTENNIKIVLGEGFDPNTKITKAEITFHKPKSKQKNSSINLRKLLGNFNKQKNRD